MSRIFRDIVSRRADGSSPLKMASHTLEPAMHGLGERAGARYVRRSPDSSDRAKGIFRDSSPKSPRARPRVRNCSRRRRADDGDRHSVRRQRLAHAERHDAVARAGALSRVSRHVLAVVLPDRADHLGLSGDGLAAAAFHRDVHRSPAGSLGATLRDGVHDDRTDPSRFQRELPDAARLGRADRRRQRDFPSRGLARRPRRRPEGGMASRRACSRSAAISASRWGR